MKHINIDIIIKRHLPDIKGRSHEEIIKSMEKITHVRLDREQLSSLEGLDLLGEHVTHLYIQHNNIEFMKPLIDCSFNNLVLICLSNNHITRIEGIKQFKKLLLLDLSENKIQQFDIEEIPKSIISLNLKNNPCMENYINRKSILEALPNIKQIDGDQLEEDADEEVIDLKKKELIGRKSLSDIRALIEQRAFKRQQETRNEHNSRIQSLDIFKTDEILLKSARLKTARSSIGGNLTK